MTSGRRRRTLEHGCACVAFSPDGKTLASGSKSGGIALWNPETGELLKDLVGHVSFMEDLAFAPDGKTIVACNVQGGVTLWDVEKGIERAILAKIGHSVYSTAISPDGQTFATGGREGTLEIWRTASEAEVQAQSDCFDPRLRLARKYQADARALRMGMRLQDALRAHSQAESPYEELAAEFPKRTDYRYSRLANQNDLVALVANQDSLLAETNRWVAVADKAVEVACRDTNQLSALLRPALLNRFLLLQHLSRPAATLNPASTPVPADAPPANAPVACSNECNRVLEVIRHVLGTEHPETPRAMRDLAVACRTQGDVAQARELAESALSGLRRVLGPDHPETLRAMEELAAIYQEHGQTAQAQELTAEVARVLRRVFGSDHPLVREKLEAFYFEQGRLAEIKELNRGVSPAQRSPTWRKVWGPVGAALQQATSACRSKRWQEAAKAFDQVLKSPAFDWEAAKVEIPVPQLWMGVAFLRAGLAERHAQLCRELAAEVETSTDSAASARRAAKVCLLPAAASPELLLQASNLLQFAEPRTTGANLIAWQHLNWGLLHFRAGRHAEALESCHQAALSTNIFCLNTAQLLRGMAAKRLGRDREAEELWRAAKAQLPQLAKHGGDLNQLQDVLVFELLLDEAELLFTNGSGPPPPVEPTPPAGRPASPN